MKLEKGTTISHYKILSEIGKGGMGEVYLALDTRLDRKVALKVLPEEFAKDFERMGRFVREAKSASALNHPNIITIYDIGEYEGKHLIAMEFVDGDTLTDYSKSRRLKYSSALDIAIRIASALEEAHAAGIIHRDIKPDNIMVRPNGHVKILDFGIAKLAGPGNGDSETLEAGEEDKTLIAASAGNKVDEFPMTTPGMIIGTANYMSPEQATGKEIDARSDIFSFGVVFYEMISGQLPFSGDSPLEIISSILKDEPKSLKGSDVPAEFIKVLIKCLRKNPDERYHDMSLLLSHLREIKQELEFQDKLEKTIEPRQDLRETQLLKAETADEPHEAEATEQSEKAETIQKSSIPKGLLAIAAVAVLAVIGLGYWYLSSAGPDQIESIAVMPFVNESGNEDVEYLSDGMTETLISSLSQLRDLDVKPRSAVFRYKGKENDPQTAGNELKVEAVLTGRITQRGDDISLYAELIDVAKNKTMWSKSYKKKQSALVTLQSDIARDVSSRITTVLSGADEENVTNLYTKNSEAYQLYLKGNFYTSKLTKEGFEKGNEFFERAIKLDPNYALAYNGIAFNQLAAMDWFSAPKIAGPKAKAAVEKAVELNEELAETQLFRGMVAHWVDWDWKTAEAAYKKAIDLDPDAFRPNGYYSWFLANMGRNDEAVAVATRCQQADPISPEANWYLGAALLAAGKSEDSIARLQTAIDLEPSYFYAHAFQGRAYLQAGRRKKALEAFKRAHELESNNFENWANLAFAQGVNGNEEEARKIIAYLNEKSEVSYVAPYYLAIAHAGLGDKERVFSLLELAIKDKSDSLILYLTADPQMEAIRTDPRYKVLLNRINLPE